MTREDSTAMTVVERALCDHFGHDPVRASIAFLGLEPIEVLRFEPIPGEVAYLSLGMSRRPMSAASGSSVEIVPTHGPRAELMLHVREDGAHADAWRQLGVLAAAPAVEGVVYSPGMTVDLGQPLAAGSRCTGVVVLESAISPIDSVGGPVIVFAATPATSTELAFSRVHGSGALRERWSNQLIDLLDLGRRSADLG
ncbi:MAG: suppressor of fused domain protein [Actinomycetota bacterium]|nr:suppressor of fused domain protein [Actinomycetota bacterium]